MWALKWLFPGIAGIRLAKPDDDPEAKRLRASQQQNDWASVQQFFGALTDPDEREFYVQQLAEWPGRPKFFDDWVSAAPECAEAWLLRGSHATRWAWEARSGARAQDVEKKAWSLFFERLQSAWSDLERAVTLSPHDPTPYAEKIKCAIGLEMKADHVHSCLEAARQRTSDPWEAHLRALYYSCKKWHGSHEQMFQLARGASDAAAEGSGLHTLVAVAHIERWLYAKSFDGHVDLARAYWRSAPVREEILQAYRQSLGSRRYRPLRASRWQRNFFAFALAKIQAQEEAAAEFNQIGDRPEQWPWNLFGDPVRVYINARRKVMV